MPDPIVLSGRSTLAELVQLGVRPYLPVGGNALCLPSLPPELGTFRNIGSLGVEFRPGVETGPVDFAWSQRSPDFSVPAKLRELDPWLKVAELCEAWRSGEPALACANSVMYELDQVGSQLRSCPAIFFTHAPSPYHTVLAFIHATHRFLGREEVPGQEQSVAGILQSLRSGAAMVGHGYMLSRPATPLRLMVLNMGSLTAIEQFLVEINWPGDTRLVTDTLMKLPRSMGVCDLAISLDVTDELGERIGIELILHRGAQEPMMQMVLDELIAADLCLGEYRPMFETWTALNHTVSPELSVFAPATGVHHRVSHVKIAFSPKGIEAKSYLECSLPRTFASSTKQEAKQSEPG